MTKGFVVRVNRLAARLGVRLPPEEEMARITVDPSAVVLIGVLEAVVDRLPPARKTGEAPRRDMEFGTKGGKVYLSWDAKGISLEIVDDMARTATALLDIGTAGELGRAILQLGGE